MPPPAALSAHTRAQTKTIKEAQIIQAGLSIDPVPLDPASFDRFVKKFAPISNKSYDRITGLIHGAIFSSEERRLAFEAEATACADPSKDEAYLAQRKASIEAGLEKQRVSVRDLQGQDGFNGKIQAKRADVERAQTALLKAQVKAQEVFETIPAELECPICTQELPAAGKIATTFCCAKTFHETCITEWFETPGGNQNCPLCREDLGIKATEAQNKKATKAADKILALIKSHHTERHALEEGINLLDSTYQQHRSELIDLIGRREELVQNAIPKIEGLLAVPKEQLTADRREQGKFLSLFLRTFEPKAFAKFLG